MPAHASIYQQPSAPLAATDSLPLHRRLYCPPACLQEGTLPDYLPSLLMPSLPFDITSFALSLLLVFRWVGGWAAACVRLVVQAAGCEVCALLQLLGLCSHLLGAGRGH